MLHLDLDDKETQILHDTLKSFISDLSYEIAGTDQHDFRESLKERRAVLEKIIQQLEQ